VLKNVKINSSGTFETAVLVHNRTRTTPLTAVILSKYITRSPRVLYISAIYFQPQYFESSVTVQSVQQIATDWMWLDSNLRGEKEFYSLQSPPGTTLRLSSGYRCSSQGQSGRNLTLTTPQPSAEITTEWSFTSTPP